MFHLCGYICGGLVIHLKKIIGSTEGPHGMVINGHRGFLLVISRWFMVSKQNGQKT